MKMDSCQISLHSVVCQNGFEDQMKKWNISAHINSVLFMRWHIYVINLLWTLHVWTEARLALGHESDSHCQRTGIFVFTDMHTHCPTWREGHRCWRRPLCVSALAGTLIGCRGPGQHACLPPAAPPAPLGWGSRLPPYGSLELHYWSSAGEGCKEE